ncbi:MAG: CDP-alcohol phosphatidyltransferase family protein [Anaerolineales bacterium]|nr:CDP-alcohol phosphatidyltransferase family protein [Anaerolineales bacterium]
MNSTQASPVEKQTLTEILRVRTHFIIDPVVTFLARYHLSPDALTILGMLAHFLFAWLISQGRFQATAVAIFFITPLDALDGALARKLGRKQGGFGAFLDSTLDRLAEIVLFAGFIWYYMGQDDVMMLGLAYVTVTGSLMVSYARARAEALGLSAKVGLLSRVERYAVLTFFLFIKMPHIALILMSVLTYVTVFQRMYHVWRQSVQDEQE